MRNCIPDPHREYVTDAVNRHRIVDALGLQKNEALHGAEREREDQLDHVVAEGQAGRAERPPDMCDRKQKRDDQHIDRGGGFRAAAHHIRQKSDRQGAEKNLFRRSGEKELKCQCTGNITRGERITVRADQIKRVPDDVGKDRIHEEHGAHDADDLHAEPDFAFSKTEIDAKEFPENQKRYECNQRLNDMMDTDRQECPTGIMRSVVDRV